MRLFVNTPMASDMIINLLTDYKDNDVEFKFIKKAGIKLEFEVNNLDGPSACNLAKILIKSTEIGSVLYFSVETV
ncbi:MAG TPA: hypothetical protein VEA58_13400 [Anaerovoracaceae bacterium]|nr:hypothetical protein [Anaerovoracaceae bacterium]